MKRNIISLLLLVSLLATMLCGCLPIDKFTTVPGSETEETILLLSGTVNCYAEPDLNSQILATFNNGLEVTPGEIITVSGLQWTKCEHGWVVLNSNSAEDATVPTEAFEPREAFIRAKLLNVREAPGESSKQVDQLPRGTFVTVYNIQKADDGHWAKVDQGWVYLKHVYFPGEEGNNTGYAVVRDDGASIKTRILEKGETVEKLKAGKRVAFLEKLEVKNGDVWIYAEGGWIKGEDVYIEGDEGLRPAHGIVVDSTPLNVRVGPGTNYEILRSLPYGTEVHVIERINRGKYDWGFVGDGWIYMEHVSLENDENLSAE